MRRFTDWLDTTINRLIPPTNSFWWPDTMLDLDITDLDAEGDQDVPVVAGEIAHLAAGILHDHRIPNAHTHATRIARAIADRYTITRTTGR